MEKLVQQQRATKMIIHRPFRAFCLAAAVTGLPQELASEVLQLTMEQPAPGWRLAGTLSVCSPCAAAAEAVTSNNSRPSQACVARLAHPADMDSRTHITLAAAAGRKCSCLQAHLNVGTMCLKP
jgi:hypothetical protein